MFYCRRDHVLALLRGDPLDPGPRRRRPHPPAPRVLQRGRFFKIIIIIIIKVLYRDVGARAAPILQPLECFNEARRFLKSLLLLLLLLS